MADKYQNEGSKTLRHYGWGVRPDLTEKFATGDEPGRADLMCVRCGKGVYVECKTGDLSWDFDSYTERQRKWAEEYCLNEPYSTPLFLWIWMGTERPNATVAPYRRRSWLLPHDVVLRTEKVIRPHQNSIPYKAGKGYNKVLQENNWDAITLWAKFECFWAGQGMWEIPENHIFRRALQNSNALEPMRALHLVR